MAIESGNQLITNAVFNNEGDFGLKSFDFADLGIAAIGLKNPVANVALTSLGQGFVNVTAKGGFEISTFEKGIRDSAFNAAPGAMGSVLKGTSVNEIRVRATIDLWSKFTPSALNNVK